MSFLTKRTYEEPSLVYESDLDLGTLSCNFKTVETENWFYKFPKSWGTGVGEGTLYKDSRSIVPISQ